GAIAKYSPDLRLVGGIELFGALPAQPQLPQQPTDADRQKLREWAQQVGERNAPFTVLAQENMLHLVIGLRYFRVNQQTMKVEADGNLAAPPAAGAAAQPQRAAPQQRTAPLLKVDKETLYVVSGRDFIAAKTADATVITRVTLPEQLFPAVNWAGMGFGNRQDRAPGADRPAGGAGGGDRGNRGGDRGGERGNRAGGGDRAQ
ncbi:MAG TPA: hypothetical protein PLZ36_16510, partial [Armatimonadota bacterium]|nr:hypothetical protein [Armatimonadota bacterium]